MAIYVIFADLWFWGIPTTGFTFVFRPKFERLYPRNPWLYQHKICRYVDTLSGCRRQFSKSGVTPKCGPQEGSNFQAGPHCAPSGGQIYANIAILLRPFRRTPNPLKMHRTWDTIPLHNLYMGASKIATFVECRVFRGTLPRNGATFWGIFCIGLIERNFCTTSDKISGMRL